MKNLITIILFLIFIPFTLYSQDLKIYSFRPVGTEKWGFKDGSGKTIINPKYDEVGPLYAKFCAVKLNGKWGFIDKNDREIVSIKYDKVNPFYSIFNNTTFFAVNLNNKWGYVDDTNKVIVPIKYDKALDGFFEGLSEVNLNGKCGFIDKNDNVIIPLKYDNTGQFINNTCRVYLNGKTGEIDKTGKEVIPIKYDEIEIFRDGLARVQINGKYGFIDTLGKEIISVKYDSAEFFHNGSSRVEINGNHYLIDKTGKSITIENKIENCNCPEPTKNDYFLVQMHSRDQTRAKEPSECDYYFEQLIMKMSCVDLKNDSREIIIQKVNCMWNKYKLNFSCNSLGFNVMNGNILKYTMNFNFSDFIYYMGDHYNVDFMFVDPADGKTIIEYFDKEIASGKYGDGKIREMNEVKAFILEKRKYNPKEQRFEPVK